MGQLTIRNVKSNVLYEVLYSFVSLFDVVADTVKSNAQRQKRRTLNPPTLRLEGSTQLTVPDYQFLFLAREFSFPLVSSLLRPNGLECKDRKWDCTVELVNISDRKVLQG